MWLFVTFREFSWLFGFVFRCVLPLAFPPHLITNSNWNMCKWCLLQRLITEQQTFQDLFGGHRRHGFKPRKLHTANCDLNLKLSILQLGGSGWQLKVHLNDCHKMKLDIWMTASTCQLEITIKNNLISEWLLAHVNWELKWNNLIKCKTKHMLDLKFDLD